MPVYGPWIQGPDYTGDAFLLDSTGSRSVVTSDEVRVNTGLTYHEAAIQQAARDTFNSAVGGGQPAQGVGLGLEVWLTWSTRTDPETSSDYATFTGTGTEGSLDVTAQYLLTPLPLPANRPPDYLSWEYEDDQATVVAAQMVWEFGGVAMDRSVEPDVPADTTPASAVLVDRNPEHANPGPPVVLQQPVDPGTFTTSGSLDVSALIGTGPEYRIQLGARWGTNPTLSALVNPRLNGFLADNNVQVSGGWNTSIIYTLRPPRHRFIFAGVEQPCRVFPREDAMAASSGARVWPPAKSQQRSNRRGPGSYW